MQKFVTHNLYGMNEYGAAVTAVLPVNEPKYVYLASEVDANIAELNLKLLEQGGELGKCQENRGKNLETIRRYEARIAKLEKELADAVHDRDTTHAELVHLENAVGVVRPVS